MKKSGVRLELMSDPSDVMQEIVKALPEPDGMPDVISMIEISSRLVEAAGYGCAAELGEADVIELFQLAAQLELKAKKLHGMQVS